MGGNQKYKEEMEKENDEEDYESNLNLDEILVYFKEIGDEGFYSSLKLNDKMTILRLAEVYSELLVRVLKKDVEIKKLLLNEEVDYLEYCKKITKELMAKFCSKKAIKMNNKLREMQNKLKYLCGSENDRGAFSLYMNLYMQKALLKELCKIACGIQYEKIVVGNNTIPERLEEEEEQIKEIIKKLQSEMP